MRRLAIAAVIAGIMLAACSDPPTHGYVWSINYEPASTIYWPGHESTSCYGSGSSRRCTSYSVPGWLQYIPDEWQIELCQQPGQPGSGNSCGWRDVDQQTYHSVRLGQYYTVQAG